MFHLLHESDVCPPSMSHGRPRKARPLQLTRAPLPAANQPLSCSLHAWFKMIFPCTVLAEPAMVSLLSPLPSKYVLRGLNLSSGAGSRPRLCRLRVDFLPSHSQRVCRHFLLPLLTVAYGCKSIRMRVCAHTIFKFSSRACSG